VNAAYTTRTCHRVDNNETVALRYARDEVTEAAGQRNIHYLCAQRNNSAIRRFRTRIVRGTRSYEYRIAIAEVHRRTAAQVRVRS